MIYKNFINIIIFFFFLNSIDFKKSLSDESLEDEQFEALIASVNSDVITTYDLSQRIKLALKSLELNDTIENRDTVRERVLELLVIEKIKKSAAIKRDIKHTDEELMNFASLLYNFPKEQFDEFKAFIEKDNNIDSNVLLEQLSSELMWKKLLQEKFSSKIVINKQEIDKIIASQKKKLGKYEYNFTEVFFENENNNSWLKTEKKIKKFLSLLDKGIAFDSLAEQYDSNFDKSNEKGLKWEIEDNLNLEIKKTLLDMKVGQISSKIKVIDGYKIIKLNKKRIFGNQNAKYTFLKVSSFDSDKLDFTKFSSIQCSDQEFTINDDITAVKIEDIKASDKIGIFLEQLEALEVQMFSNVIEYNNQFSVLKLCDKKNEETEQMKRNKIQSKLYSQKFNQLSNTFLANLRQNANIEFFNK